MSSLRLVVVAAVAAVCYAAVAYAPPHKQVSKTKVASSAPVQNYEQVRGNVQPDVAPSTYSVLVVPANYKTDPVSADILRGFEKDSTLVALRQKSEFVKYSADHPDYKHRLAGKLPEASSKPVLWVYETTADGKITSLYKRSGATTKQVAYELGKLRILDRVKPNKPSPICPPNTPTPTTPTTPPVVDTPATPPETPVDDTPVEEEEDRNPLLAVLSVLGGGAIAWAAMSKIRMG